MDKPDALRLAARIEKCDRCGGTKAAAAELRRLVAQRDALLEALKLAKSIIGHPDDAHSQMIDDTIKAVEKNT